MIYFLTFAGPTKNLYDAQNRIINQALQLNIFDKIIKITDKDLKEDKDFWNKHSQFVEKNPQGYGYYIWKPYIIKKTLDSIKKNDILVYLDVGCEINVKQKSKFLKFLDLVNEKNIIGSSCSSNDINYTKKDLLLHFNYDVEKDRELLEKNHMQAGILFLKKVDIITDLLNEWYECCSNNYYLLDDSPSVNENEKEFRENRHDQSIFNLLVKKKNLINYDLDPVNFEIKKLKKAINYPIIAIRNKTGKSYV